jgi:alpha-galactosidase
MMNAGWVRYGARADGAVHVLDTTRPEVLDHLTEVAATLVAAGFPYLKLDFTYAPSLPGRYADPTRTPAQRVRAGFDAIRRGAGHKAFLLGCGAPLGPVIGAVDGMRIGPDVAPWWEPLAGADQPPGYEGAEPATMNAWRATLARSFLHRRLWVNDPDCVLLRTTDTAMGEAAVEAWAWAVSLSGGMALVSDDLALLGPAARARFDDVLARGRAVDDAARAPDGHPPRCPDLLDRSTPTRLRSDASELVGDPDRAVAVLREAQP